MLVHYKPEFKQNNIEDLSWRPDETLIIQMMVLEVPLLWVNKNFFRTVGATALAFY